MSKEEQDKESALYLPALQTSANALKDARDALAGSLIRLKPISGVERKEPLVVSYCFLSGADLEKVQLTGVDLTGSHLHGAELTAANLARAILRWANFQKAVLSRTDLKGAIVESANFQQSILFGADLRGLFFFHTQLQQADLCHAQLAGSMMNDAFLYRTKVAGSDVDRALTLPADWENSFDFTQGDGNLDYKLKQAVGRRTQ